MSETPSVSGAPKTVPAEKSGAALAVARWALAAIAVLVPLAISNLTAIGFTNPFTMDQFAAPKLLVFVWPLAVAVGAWSVYTLRSRSGLRLPAAWPFGAAFLGLALVSAALSPHWASAFFGTVLYRQGFVTLALYAVLVWVCVQVVRSARDLRALAWSVVIGGVLVAFYGLLQSRGLDPTHWGETSVYMFERGFSTLANPDVYGGFLVVPLCLAVALSLERRSTATTVWAGVGAAIIWAAIVTSMTRAAWLGALCGAAVVLVVWWRSPLRSMRVAAIFLALALAVTVGAGAVTLTNQSAGINDRVAELASPSTSPGLQSRLVIWRAAVATIAEKPLLGEGPDSFRFGWYRHEPASTGAQGAGYLVADDAHNLPLFLAATVGVPAMLAFIGLWLMTFVGAFRAVNRTREKPDLAYAGWLGAGVALAAYSLFGIGFVGIGTTAALVLGVLLAPLSRKYEPHAAVRAVAVALVAVLSLGGVVYGTLGYASETQIVASYVTPGLERAYAERAVALAPWNISARERLAEAIDAAALGQDSSGIPITTRAAAASRAYESLIAFEPAEYFSYVQYASFLAAVSPFVGPSATAEATKVLERARKVRPNAVELTKPQAP